MNNEDHPLTPYSSAEQQRIMCDLERSLSQAREQSDRAKIFYLSAVFKDYFYEEYAN